MTKEQKRDELDKAVKAAKKVHDKTCREAFEKFRDDVKKAKQEIGHVIHR